MSQTDGRTDNFLTHNRALRSMIKIHHHHDRAPVWTLERSRFQSFYELTPLFSVLGKSPCWVESVVERMEVTILGSEPGVTWTSWTALRSIAQ